MVSARYRRGEGKKVVTVGMLGFRYSSDAAVGSGEGEDEVEGGCQRAARDDEKTTRGRGGETRKQEGGRRGTRKLEGGRRGTRD